MGMVRRSRDRIGWWLMGIQRNLPARGFRPGVVLVGVAGLMTFGFWRLGKGIREHKYAPIDLPSAIELSMIWRCWLGLSWVGWCAGDWEKC